MENLISVIVITYNQERTIGRALDSILNQRCHLPLEIIIGEDASIDGTRKICETYAERFPKVVKLMEKAPNKGIVDNYFDCLLTCKGKFIADCAGDDYWTDPEKLEKEVYILEREPDVTLVHTAWQYLDEQTGEILSAPPTLFPVPRTDGKKMLEAIITQVEQPVIHLCTSLYRASTILEAYGEDTRLFRDKSFQCEDLQVAFSLALCGKIAYLPDVTLSYSIGKNSVSHQDNARKQFRFVKGVSQLSFYLCQKHRLSDPDIDRYFRRRVYALFMHAFRAHDRQMRGEAKACQEEWQVKPTLPIYLVDGVTRTEWTWRLCLLLRKLFVWCKKARTDSGKTGQETAVK